MKNLKSVNHIGYACFEIPTTAKYYLKAGWDISEIYEEKVQNTKIAFLSKEGFPTIELVAPLNDSPSPVDNVLKKNGITPYHICYDVDDIEEAVEDLYEEGFNPLFMPVASIAMDNHKICYLQHKELGILEIVET